MGLTTLLQMHRASGACFATVADPGAEMAGAEAGRWRPLHYGDPASEHAAALRGAVLIDRSQRGRLRITGTDRLSLLQRLSTNQVASLSPGSGVQNLFLTGKGRLIALFDLLLAEDHALLCLSDDRVSSVREWIERYVFTDDVQLSDVTGEIAELLVAGPAAPSIIEGIGVEQPESLELRDTRPATLGGTRVLVGAAEPLASVAYRILVVADDAVDVWQTLLERAAELEPAGAEVEEILRVEAGIPGAGREVDERFNPLEVGLADSISFDKGCYTGQEVVARLRNYDKVQRRLCRIELAGDSLPARGTTVELDGVAVGLVTSAVHSPARRRPIALALIRRASAVSGARVSIAGTPGVIELPPTGRPGPGTAAS